MKAVLIKKKRLGAYTRLVFQAAVVARRAQPGQFVEIRINGDNAPFWRRPFSICRAWQDQVELLVKTVGRGSALLTAMLPGSSVDMLGPLGKGFTIPAGKHAWVLVGGGFGIAPLLFLAERLQAKKHSVTVLAGGRCQDDLLLRQELRQAGAKVACTTEDGSAGVKGRVTLLLEPLLQKDVSRPRVAAAGPIGMLRAVTQLAQRCGATVEVSMEEMMACGLGVCNGCVVKVGGRFQRVCKDGPVFSGQEVEWPA